MSEKLYDVDLSIYIIKQDIHIYIYVFPIAGQTARPIGLKFFMGSLGVSKAKKNPLKKKILQI